MPPTAVMFGPQERGLVYAIARRIVGSPDDADDVAQEALLLAYRYRASFRGEARFHTWLYRIATTAALSYLRRRGRSREHLAPTDAAVGHDVADPTPLADAALAEHEAIAQLRAAIAQLDPMYRDVLLARAEYGEAECATRLGITLANVKVRAHRARKQLALSARCA